MNWDAFIAEHGVAEYVRTRYLDRLAQRVQDPKWLDDDLAENKRRFGPSKYVAQLRERMTKYLQGGASARDDVLPNAEWRRQPSPEPHKFPCEDPYCMPCAEAIKRIFRDLNLLPKGNHGADYSVDPITGRLKVPARWRKDDLE